jgi:peptidoglycan/LPS O-acetylase OafA/YrhL
MDWNLPGISEISWADLLTSMTFTQTLFHGMNKYFPGGWTVSVEFLFYMMLPFLCAGIRNLNSSIVFLLITLLLIPVYDTVFKYMDFKFIFFSDYYTIFYQLPVFSLGIFAYWMVNDKDKKINNSTLLLLFVTILFYCFIRIPDNFLFGLVFTSLLTLLQRSQYKILSNRILARVGLVSYSMYILHFPVIHFLNYIKFSRMIPVTDFYSSFFSFILMCVVITAITYPLSYITYKFIEVPGQNLGRKLIKKLNQQK